MDESIRQQQSCLAEQLGKEWHDDQKRKVERIDGPMILGAGPSGLATAACLREQGISYVMVDRADCVASLWQHRTYDRLKLHLPKSFCELPLMGFPRGYPAYPSRQQFIDYVVSYANHFDIRPRFNESVESAVYEKSAGVWRVTTLNLLSKSRTDYICRLLVVATGENSEAVTPHIEGLQSFKGSVIHVISYKTGADYKGQRVLVVGCGNSGMEVSLDLFNHGAKPFMVVRSSVHVLPREILGISSFAIATALAKWLPLWVVDKFLVLAAFLLIGDTERFGVGRPSIGPLQLKDETGQTPVLDIGAMEHIKSGGIKIVPAVERLTPGGAIFVDGRELEFDSVVLATGYKSSVPCWLKGCDFFTEAGMPKTPFPNGWKGDNGLYTVGFTRRGLLGASADARRIARDIAGKLSKKHLIVHGRPCVLCSEFTSILRFY